MKIVLVLDGDDTLWMNEWQYSKARANFFAFLYEEFGRWMPSLKRVPARYWEIDNELFAIWGIRRGRVFFGMQKVYHELLEYFKKKLSKDIMAEILERQPEHEKIIYELGDQPFNFRDLTWVDGAQAVLQRLKEEGYTLCLLTSYDENIWPDRGAFLGVEKYFSKDRIRAVPGRKTEEDFIAVSGYDEDMSSDTLFCAIGNGETDILPALEISDKWRGIYIPYGSGSPLFNTEKGDDWFTPPPIEHPRVINLKSIAQLGAVDFENFSAKSPT